MHLRLRSAGMRLGLLLAVLCGLIALAVVLQYGRGGAARAGGRGWGGPSLPWSIRNAEPRSAMVSAKGRPIPVCVFGKGSPSVLIIAGVHGDERGGVLLAMELIRRLRSLPAKSFSRKVIVMPLVNPDGYAANTRVNANSVDINRNFPARNYGARELTGRYFQGSGSASEPETRAIMRVIDAYKPDTIVSIHAPLACVDYSGPSAKLADVVSRITRLPAVGAVGYPTPGSMGSYYGGDRGLKVITLEMDNPREANWPRYGNALLAAAGFAVKIPPAPQKTTTVTTVARTDDGGKRGAPMTEEHRPVVCIDPGHPSEVSAGDSPQQGLTEVQVNWDVAQSLAAILGREGVEVMMTKSDVGETVTNRQRAEIANRADAAAMIRLHCDTGNGAGFTFYYPDRQGTVDGVTGPTDDVIARSRTAAETIHRSMSALAGKLKDNGVKGDSATLIGGRQGALTGSVFSRVPTVTVEMVFLSDKADAQFIGSDDGRRAMAEALAAGVMAYLRARH